MASTMLGKICSPFSRNSTALPPTIGAPAYASSVGKNDGSPSESGGTERWGVTAAHPVRAATATSPTTTLHSRARIRIKAPGLVCRHIGLRESADRRRVDGASFAELSSAYRYATRDADPYPPIGRRS